jgi:activating signal cointegrator complex subunit 3
VFVGRVRGVNLPAHLVIVKGTEYYDAKVNRYVDFPVTDLLQCLGRAGRPGFDSQGVGVVFVHEPKKNFYLNFANNPFPVESSLFKHLHNHINAEVNIGTIKHLTHALDYLSWTFAFRRILQNPSYYNIQSNATQHVQQFLTNTLSATLKDLESAGLIKLDAEDDSIEATQLGNISSYYYLDYKTVKLFNSRLTSSNSTQELIEMAAACTEYEELPVRHNEDLINKELNKSVPWRVEEGSDYSSAAVKCYLLFQCHLFNLPLPLSDYATDLKSLLDQAIRIFQAMIDIAVYKKLLNTTLALCRTIQQIVQSTTLPHKQLQSILYHFSGNNTVFNLLKSAGIDDLAKLLKFLSDSNNNSSGLSNQQIKELKEFLSAHLPQLSLGRIHRNEKSLTVQINSSNGKKSSFRVLLGRNSLVKNKLAGHWLIVGDGSNNNLLAMKRIISLPNKSFQLSFNFAEDISQSNLVISLLNDSYLQLDSSVASTVAAAIPSLSPAEMEELYS